MIESVQNPHQTLIKKTSATEPSSSASTNCLESFESFVNSMGDWKEPLQSYTNCNSFRQLYNFVKKEYQTPGNLCYPPHN